MGESLEIEYKTMLSEKEYIALLHHYKITDSQFVEQTNLYFDTKDFQLKQLGMGLRIRFLQDHAEATLKVPQTVGLLEITDPLAQAEVVRSLDTQLFTEQAPSILSYLKKLEISADRLALIGQLKTKRAEFMIAEGRLALDESWYEDLHDHELELEVPSSSFTNEQFLSFLASHHLPYRQAQNKIARAVHAKENKNKQKGCP